MFASYQEKSASWNWCTSYHFLFIPKFSNTKNDRFLNLYVKKKCWGIEGFLGAHIQKNRKVKKFFYFFAKSQKNFFLNVESTFLIFGSRSLWKSPISRFFPALYITSLRKGSNVVLYLDWAAQSQLALCQKKNEKRGRQPEFFVFFLAGLDYQLAGAPNRK